MCRPIEADQRRMWWLFSLAPLMLAVVIGLAPMAMKRVLLLLVFAPITEEVVFREGMQQWLWRRGWSARAAMLAVTLAFGLAHAWTRSPLLGLAVLLPAQALGWLYTRSASLWFCVLAHAAMNAVWLMWCGVEA